MDQKRAEELIDRYVSGECSPEEKAVVETWFNQLSAGRESTGISDLASVKARISAGLPEGSIIVPKKVRLWPRIAAAAMLIVSLGIGYYIYDSSKISDDPVVNAVGIVKPGGNRAFLTLADGRKIDLTTAASGELARQSGVKIEKNADGSLVYSVSGGGATGEMNTVETPRGGQYQVHLPDGTRVWLNAASSLRYPASFAGATERKVELSGEGYFEVAKVALASGGRLPFIVATADQQVKVLGTHFNVNAYKDEALTSTTLLEGSVRVSGSGGTKMLRPDEQAVSRGGSLSVGSVDSEEAIAWKNGKFVFVDEDLSSVMRKIARWYDVEVIYQTKKTGNAFSGTMGRFEDISEVLRKVALTGEVHFRLEGRRVFVMK